MKNSPAIKLGTGIIRYECRRCGFKVIVPPINQGPGCQKRNEIK
jgi:lipopolysaccharide biosynthesis regulator YciM